MTNNPTIDGVSRAKIHHLKIHRKPFDDLVSGRKTNEVRNCADREFREGDHVELFLIDETGNPANKSIVRTITHIQRGYGLPDDICVLSYAPIDAPGVERQGVTNGPLIKDLCELNADQQSTIARLEARVAELESGRGEPVAWLAEAVGPDGTAYRRTSSTTSITLRDAKHAWGDGVISKYEIKIQPLFTAPPAPVAVAIDEQQAFANWTHEVIGMRGLAKVQRRDEMTVEQEKFALKGWLARACLDATAALNGVKS